MSRPNQPADSSLKLLNLFLEEAESTLAALRSKGAVSPAQMVPVLKTLLGSSSTLDIFELSRFLRESCDALDSFQLSSESFSEEQVALARDVLQSLEVWIKELKAAPSHEHDVNELRARIRKLSPTSVIPDLPPEVPKAKPKLLGEALVEKSLVTPEQVDQAVKIQERKLGEVMVDEGMISKDALDKTLQQIGKAADVGVIKKVGEQIRVPATRIDDLMKIVSELSIHHAIIRHAKQKGTLDSDTAQNAISLSDKIIREIQGQVMALRLQPVKGLFQKMERVARDVAISQGKKVEIRVEGAEVDLDKAVIEKIMDPLQHIVRNGLDHGIEEPAERESLGKSATAVLSIVANAGPSEVQIIVSDNGRGMDPRKLIAKGIEKGFIDPSASISDEEAYKLIFLPGFSTAEKVTEFSGRGVGMDVVNQVIRDLGGSVVIRSELGKGTTFTINLPTSVSLMDAVVFYVQGLRYVVPMRDLIEVVDIVDFKLEGSLNHGYMMNLRGKIVPVEPLHRYLASEKVTGQNVPKDMGRPALLVETGRGPLAFEVDSIAGQQQIVVRNLSGNMSKIRGCVGGTILGDGEPGVILGLPGLAKEYFDQISGNRKDPS